MQLQQQDLDEIVGDALAAEFGGEGRHAGLGVGDEKEAAAAVGKTRAEAHPFVIRHGDVKAGQAHRDAGLGFPEQLLGQDAGRPAWSLLPD